MSRSPASTPRSPRLSSPSLATLRSPHPNAAPLPCYFVTSLLRISISTQNRDPSFTTSCALFLIRNSAYPYCFVATAHSLPRSPGVGCPYALQISALLTPMESISFQDTPSKPFRIYLFRNRGGGQPILQRNFFKSN